MGLLDKLFGAWHARGRLAKAPSGHTGGALAPASVQRAHLGVKALDLPAGVVTLRTGEVRAILAVDGLALHARDADDVLDFLRGWAAACNALPADVALLSRARPGGLDDYADQKAAASTALARVAPGTDLAKLAASQRQNALGLVAKGWARKVVCWLAVRDAKGDVPRLLERAEQAAARLRDAGLHVTPLKDRALAAAISDSWRPGLTDGVLYDAWVPGHRGEPGYEWTINIESDGRTTRAKVNRPRYVEPGAPALPAGDRPAASKSLPAQERRTLSSAGRKALPR